MTSQPTAYDYLEAVACAVLLVRTGRVLWANSAAADLTGYTRDRLSGMGLQALFPPERLSDGQETNQQAHLISVSGAAIQVSITRRHVEMDGLPAEIITLAESPASSPVQPLSTEAASESVLRNIAENSLDGFYLFRSVRDSSGQVIDSIFEDVNQRGVVLSGFTREQLIGHSVCELYTSASGSYFMRLHAKVLESGEPLEEDYKVIEPQSSVEWLRHQIIPLGDRVAVFTRDISERRRIEQALGNSERKFQALLDQTNDCISLLDLEGNYLLVNRKLAESMGYTPEEMTTMHLRQFIVLSDPNACMSVFDALLEGQQVPLFECTYRRKDGSQFQGEVSVSLVRDDSGQPQYVQTIMRDITWRNAAERALRESEERYRIISESISDYAYAFRIEPDGTLVSEWITDSFMRMTGYSPEEIDSKGQYALYYPGEETRVAADLAQALAGEAVSGEYRIVTKSGETRWVNIHRKPVWDEAHSHVVRLIGVAQDITKRKESEENLRRSEEQYRLIAENATDMISRVTTDDERIYVSPSCRALLGYEPEELIGPNSSTLIHPDDVADMETAWSAIEQTNAPVTFTCRMLHKNGEYRWFEVTGKSILTDTGEVKEYIALSRDISARLQMEAILKEQDRLRYELQSEQQLSDIKSSLMRTISHEFRTPLALILTSTDFLDTYFDRLDAQKRKDRLQSIRVQIKRLSDMLDDISFVVQGTLHHMTAHPSPMNLEEYTRSIVEEIETSIGRNHHFAFTTDGTLTQGVADKALVLRILTNLLSNAIKYSPENSIIAVDLRRRGGDAVLEVSDQGIGISAEEQKRIFEPFYRSASVIDTVGGTGLGLSIVKDCVLLHGGSISVRSALNRGTTFTVQLPQSNT